MGNNAISYKKSTKVLHIISALETGGAEKLLCELLPALIRQGIDCELLVFKRVHSEFEKKLEKQGILIHSLDAGNVYNPRNIFRLRKFFKGYDLIHAHLFPTGYFCAAATLGSNIKCIYTEHSTSNRRREYPILHWPERFIYKRFTKTICISEAVRKYLTEWLGEGYDYRMEVINNGIDLEPFEKATGIMSPEPYILMVSRFGSMKDQATVIKAFAQLHHTHLRLKFAGAGPGEGPCRELADRLGVSDRVDFLGERRDIPELMKGAYIGVQSSLYEGFGLTAAEFMAAGVPVIASDVPGLKDVVAGAGLLFKVEDASDLASKIDSLIDDKSLRLSTIEIQQKRVKNFTIDRMAAEYAAIYNSLCTYWVV